MSERKISDIFNVERRFLRSVQLERDFNDPSILKSYIPTEFSKLCFTRITEGLLENSTQRAWRMTGDYGSGKSSFALLLAHAFSGKISPNSNIGKSFDLQQAKLSRMGFIPILVTCSRRSITTSILEALLLSLTRIYTRGRKARAVSDVETLLHSKNRPSDEQFIEVIQRVNLQLITDGKASGVLLILDELGKFLEYAAQNPNGQDIYLLQRLAEAAARSGTEPFFMVCLLHQGFNAYAEILEPTAQREWEKVAGRFDEIVFNQPVEQIAQLIASSLNISLEEIPRPIQNILRSLTQRTFNLGWLGSEESVGLLETSSSLFPLHPTILPVLIRFFRRFGQNERSLFSFLLSSEPFGLKAFSETKSTHDGLYGLWNLFDYVRTNFGHKLSVLSYRSHWTYIDSLIESFATSNPVHIQILKTIGIINLLNDHDIIPTEDVVICALTIDGKDKEVQIREAITELRQGKRALYDRGRARGLCLWPHTSVDLEKAIEEARKAIPSSIRVASMISDYLDVRPIVARRHYIETGNLRHFEIKYVPVAELDSYKEYKLSDSDGIIIIPLCETVAERQLALMFAKDNCFFNKHNWLVAVPQPLSSLSSLMHEAQKWEWVSINVAELNGDRYAREEVSRQTEAARSQLERRIQNLLSVSRSGGDFTLEWYHGGSPISISDSRYLLRQLSLILDETYDQAVKLNNEMINRRSLSSAATKARMQLIERIFKFPDRAFLEMPPHKKPPEMAIYLSLLQRGGIHVKNGSEYSIRIPTKGQDRCNLLPSLKRMKELIEVGGDKRINVSELIYQMSQPPFGLREGLFPILLTILAVSEEQDIAFYKEETFLHNVTPDTMVLLIKAPERFSLQYCKIEGIRAELYKRISNVLEVDPSSARRLEILEVVKPLCVFVAQLPDFVRNTRHLPQTTMAVRDAILNAMEPMRLLYTDLPTACGFPSFTTDGSQKKYIQPFISSFKTAIENLRNAHQNLRERILDHLKDGFDLSGHRSGYRRQLALRSEKVIVGVSEPRLKALCLRLIDEHLSEIDWIESVGSLMASTPPSRWTDNDEDGFHKHVFEMSSRFKHIESIVFANVGNSTNSVGIRLSVTRSDGTEKERVVHYTPQEEREIGLIQESIKILLKTRPRLGLAAVSRAIWAELELGEHYEK